MIQLDVDEFTSLISPSQIVTSCSCKKGAQKLGPGRFFLQYSLKMFLNGDRRALNFPISRIIKRLNFKSSISIKPEECEEMENALLENNGNTARHIPGPLPLRHLSRVDGFLLLSL